MYKYLYPPLRTYLTHMRPWVLLLALALFAGACGAPSYGAPPAQAPAAPAAPSYGAPPAQAPAAPAATPATLPSTGAGGQSAGQTMKVSINNSAFVPKALTVASGTTVEWQNNDSTAHTVTADNGAFDSGNLNQGATFKFTFAKAGTYAYYCRYHGGPGGQGMSGQIIVK